MSLTSWQPTVKRIKDGEAVDQATVNVTVDQLTQRDQHLYDKFDEMSGKSALISFGKAIFPTEILNPGELNVVYFKGDGDSAGLSKAVTGFSSTSSSSMFAPSNSNFAFGLIKTVYTSNKTADVYTEGLCEFQVDIDDSVLGLLQKDASGRVESFAVGPYFLSSKSPGKLTNDPSGIPVYVGYAISKREFLLHTSVDEFSQFFINHRYHILDRVAGTPVLSSGTWIVNNSDITKLGWIAAGAAKGIAPEGALLYYNIPAALLAADAKLPDEEKADPTLTDEERLENLDISKHFPPVPANFIQLFRNGTLLRYSDIFDTGGVYSVNEYGLWWHTLAENAVPWSASYPARPPEDWSSYILGFLGANRVKIFTSFSKFNPALRTQLVSSIAPFNTKNLDGTPKNKAANFIKFYNADNLTEPARTGDIFVDILAPVYYKGFNDNSSFTYPSTITPTYTAGRAVAAFTYDPTLGGFKAASTPVVAKIVGRGDITASDAGDGVWSIGYTSGGLTGQVDSIDPINSRIEFRGLTSYIKLPPPSATKYGLIGKIVLPKGYANNQKLNLVFHLFGDVNVGGGYPADNNAAFQLEYSAVSATNGASPSAYTTVGLTSFKPETNPIEFALTTTGEYSAYTSIKLSDPLLAIPADFIREDTVINFQILRVAPATASYTGNVCLLGIYWEIGTV